MAGQASALARHPGAWRTVWILALVVGPILGLIGIIMLIVGGVQRSKS